VQHKLDHKLFLLKSVLDYGTSEFDKQESKWFHRLDGANWVLFSIERCAVAGRLALLPSHVSLPLPTE
jgi:hypothetical protein